MGSLSSAKTLGGVGGILVFIPILSLVGWILILLATRDISESVQDKTIFDDALLAAITAIIGAVVFVFVWLGFLFTPRPSFGFFVLATFLPFIAALGTFWILTVISAFFLKRSYEKISQRLNVGAFASAGLLYLIGAALTIVIVGFLILLIALIFQVVAYFSIQDRPPVPSWSQSFPQAPTSFPSATAQQPSVEPKFCFKCGTKLPSAAVFCTSCGSKQS